MSLRTVEFCVFDEADRLFEMGFAVQLREILSKMNEARQVLSLDALQHVTLQHVTPYKQQNGRRATENAHCIALLAVQHLMSV